MAADMDGAFPEGFYSYDQPAHRGPRSAAHWIEVADQEMDCGVVVDASRADGPLRADDDVTVAACQFVVGHAGVRVFPPERTRRTARLSSS